MRNPFKKRTPAADPDTDPIFVTHAQDPSLDEDEMVIYTTVDPASINNKDKK